MRFRAILSLVVAFLLVTGAFSAGQARFAPPPLPGDNPLTEDATPEASPNGSPEASPVAGTEFTTDASCSAVPEYYDEFNTLLSESGAFIDFVMSDEEPEDIEPDVAVEVVEDGNALLDDYRAMTVPEAYLPAHEGLILFFDYFIDIASTFGVDSSNVPDANAYDDAMMLIYEGEVAIADACPDEVEEVGGYLNFDPAQIKEDYGIDD